MKERYRDLGNLELDQFRLLYLFLGLASPIIKESRALLITVAGRLGIRGMGVASRRDCKLSGIYINVEHKIS